MQGVGTCERHALTFELQVDGGLCGVVQFVAGHALVDAHVGARELLQVQLRTASHRLPVVQPLDRRRCWRAGHTAVQRQILAHLHVAFAAQLHGEGSCGRETEKRKGWSQLPEKETEKNPSERPTGSVNK